MMNYLEFGHFDTAAMKDHRLLVVQKMQHSDVMAIANEFGAAEDGDEFLVDGIRFFRHPHGYYFCASPVLSVKAVDFATALVQRTGCVVGDDDTGTVMNLAAFRFYADTMLALEE